MPISSITFLGINISAPTTKSTSTFLLLVKRERTLVNLRPQKPQNPQIKSLKNRQILGNCP